MCKTAEKLAATTFTTIAVILNIHFSTFCTLFYDMINKISNKYFKLAIKQIYATNKFVYLCKILQKEIREGMKMIITFCYIA